jgi:dimethylsulfone monooxygenase
LASPHRLKLAVFGANVSGGCSVTAAPGTVQVDWDESVRIALAAEAAGIEAMIPVARWKGFGGKVNFNHRNFETFTWAAGLAAATSKIGVFATFHVPTAPPVRAAKEVATIDHISKGRFGLNVVAGWNAEEIGMFGTPQAEHDVRYAVADEWMTLVKRLWTENNFDFDGQYYQAPGAYSEPKPLQNPYPPIMSAGTSPAGLAFAGKHADLNFIMAPNVEAAAEMVANIKRSTAEQFGRSIRVFGQGYIICRETEAEARAYHHRVVHELGDLDGVRRALSLAIPNSQSLPPEVFQQMAPNFVAGYGAMPLVGTPDQVVRDMVDMADAGLDGITLSWIDYDAGLEQFRTTLLPRLIEAGLREREG